MKSLEDIKNKYAVSKGYYDFYDLLIGVINNEVLSEHVNEVMILVQKECLLNASDKFKQDEYGFKEHYTRIITNENNIIK